MHSSMHLTCRLPAPSPVWIRCQALTGHVKYRVPPVVCSTAHRCANPQRRQAAWRGLRRVYDWRLDHQHVVLGPRAGVGRLPADQPAKSAQSVCCIRHIHGDIEQHALSGGGGGFRRARDRGANGHHPSANITADGVVVTLCSCDLGNRCLRFPQPQCSTFSCGVQTIFAGKSSLCHALSVILRTGNTFLGSLWWVDFARLIGLQPKGDTSDN